MKVLRQWRETTARGDKEIIAKANEVLECEYEIALALVTKPLQVLTTIEDATELFINLELGTVIETEDPNKL